MYPMGKYQGKHIPYLVSKIARLICFINHILLTISGWDIVEVYLIPEGG